MHGRMLVEVADRFFRGIVDIEDRVQTRELEDGVHVGRHAAEVQAAVVLPRLFVDLEDRAEDGGGHLPDVVEADDRPR